MDLARILLGSLILLHWLHVLCSCILKWTSVGFLSTNSEVCSIYSSHELCNVHLFWVDFLFRLNSSIIFSSHICKIISWLITFEKTEGHVYDIYPVAFYMYIIFLFGEFHAFLRSIRSYISLCNADLYVYSWRVNSLSTDFFLLARLSGNVLKTADHHRIGSK